MPTPVNAVQASATVPPPHNRFEDAQGLLVGTAFVALAVLMLQHAGLLTGGTAGVAFLLHYTAGWSMGGLLFLVNLPFYIFAWAALGPVFTLRTFIAVGMLALWVDWLPLWLRFEWLHPVLAAVLGGVLAGTGLLILVRHQASLGGIGILAVYLQKRLQWRAGLVQMAFDVCILVSSLWVIASQQVVLSLLGAVTLNAVIAVNHRNGRYMGV